MALLFLFILGVCVGSFLNVLVDRIPHGEQVFRGRSYCDNCKKNLRWFDMIPVLSFLILKGKCRHCHSLISFYYPLVEILTGLIFIIIYLYVLKLNNLPFAIFHFPFNLTIQQFSNVTIDLFYYLFIASSLTVIFFTDLKYGIIPDKIVYPAVVVSVIYHFPFTIFHLPFDFNNLTIQQFSNYLLSAFGAFIFLLILFLITKGKGMGFGDVKLAFLMGLFLGFPLIVGAFYLAFLTGASVGIILVIWGKKKLPGGKIPFGPFLVLGTFLSLFFGEQLTHLGLLLLNF